MNWTLRQRDPLPPVPQMRTFVADHEQARASRFTATEGEVLDAGTLAICAYGARCQHSDMALHPEIAGLPDTRWIRLLRERGETGLLL